MDGNWKVVLSTSNIMEAEVVAGRLKTEGIEVQVHQEPAGEALGLTMGLLGEVDVLVHEADYEAALALLEAEAPPATVAEE